jgi:hypothetical protein
METSGTRPGVTAASSVRAVVLIDDADDARTTPTTRVASRRVVTMM